MHKPAGRTRALAFGLLLLLGHSLGVGFLELKAKRAETLGMYVAALQRDDAYATIDWDDFVYYPRAVAVAEGWWPIDPWVHHDQSLPTWGIIPPLPATIFGSLLRVTGDFHSALYVATILATVLIGSMVAGLLRGAPFGLTPWAALLGAVVFVKMPWLAVKAQQFIPPWRFVTDTIAPFIFGRPLDAFTTVEAGLFTYAFYVLFLVLFWRAAYGPDLRRFMLAGGAAGLLIYVYFYHYIYAFALLASWIAVALLRRRWRHARLGTAGLLVGLICTIPHFTNFFLASSSLDVPAYVSRLGVEPGRFVFGNLRYLAALAIPLLLGLLYARRVQRSDLRSPTLGLLAALILAYIGVHNLRVVLGFDVQSDHYWRQSLALPATLWVLIVLAELRWRAWSQLAWVLAAVLAFGVIFSNLSWLTGRTHPEPPSPGQLLMAERAALVVALASPGDVVLIDDVATAYHAAVNGRVRPFVPFVHALASREEILRRFYTAQCLTGVDGFHAPSRVLASTRDETAVVHSEQKYLLGTDDAAAAADLLPVQQAVESQCRSGSLPPQPRLDVILVPRARQASARARIAQLYEIVAEETRADYWAARVAPRGTRP